MHSSRIALVLAIAAGGSLGAILAVLLAGPVQRHVRWLAPTTATAAAVASTPIAVVSASASGSEAQAPAPRAHDLDRASQRCAWGFATDCLLAADAVELGQGARVDATRVLELRRRARSLELDACMTKRDAGACWRAAAIARSGGAGPRDPAQADALEQRARTLCHEHAVAACADVDGG